MKMTEIVSPNPGSQPAKKVSWQDLAAQNKLQGDAANRLSVGQQIQTPTGVYTVKSGDTLSGIADRLNTQPAPAPVATAKPAASATAQQPPTGGLVDTSGRPVVSGHGIPVGTGFSAPATTTATARTPATGSQLPRGLMARVADVESGNNPSAVGSKGETGKLQVMPHTLRDPGFGIRPAQDSSAAERDRVGTEYMSALMNKYGGDTQRAIAAYNAGPGSVDKALSQADKTGRAWTDFIPQATRDQYLPKYGDYVTPHRQSTDKLTEEDELTEILDLLRRIRK